MKTRGNPNVVLFMCNQLFDLEADPEKQKDITCDPEHASLLQELKNRLMELIIRQDIPVPPRDLAVIGAH